MEVTYKNKHLQKCAENEKYSLKNLGTIRSKKYLQRVADLCEAETLEDVRYLPGNYHELTGDRKGQWAVSLDIDLYLLRMSLRYQLIKMENMFGSRSKVWKLMILIIITENNNLHNYNLLNFRVLATLV